MSLSSLREGGPGCESPRAVYGTRLKCQLPAGRYRLEIRSESDSFVPPPARVLEIKGNKSLSYPTKTNLTTTFFSSRARAALVEVFSAAGLQQLKYTHYSNSGCERFSMGEGETICAESPTARRDDVKALFDVHPEFVRVAAWEQNPVLDNMLETRFRVGSEIYMLYLRNYTTDAGVHLELSRIPRP